MFDAHGTEGLELFTWIVASIGGLVAALILTSFITIKKKESVDEEIEEPDRKNHKETIA